MFDWNKERTHNDKCLSEQVSGLESKLRTNSGQSGPDRYGGVTNTEKIMFELKGAYDERRNSDCAGTDELGNAYV